MVQGVGPAAAQDGFGFASFLIIVTLLARLAERGVMTRHEIKEILDHALASAEVHQSAAPYSADMMLAAQKTIQTVLNAWEVKTA